DPTPNDPGTNDPGTNDPGTNEVSGPNSNSVAPAVISVLNLESLATAIKHAGEHPITLEAIVVIPEVYPSRYEILLSNVDRGGLRLAFNEEGWETVAFTTAGKEKILHPNPLKAGGRHHVAATFDGKRLRMFLNGTCVAQADLRGTLRPSTRPFQIGTTPVEVQRELMTFSGDIEQARISRTARYAADFAPAQRLKTDGDTLAVYHSDQAFDGTASDASTFQTVVCVDPVAPVEKYQKIPPSLYREFGMQPLPAGEPRGNRDGAWYFNHAGGLHFYRKTALTGTNGLVEVNARPISGENPAWFIDFAEVGARTPQGFRVTIDAQGVLTYRDTSFGTAPQYKQHQFTIPDYEADGSFHTLSVWLQDAELTVFYDGKEIATGLPTDRNRKRLAISLGVIRHGEVEYDRLITWETTVP
ncbi:MAG TPA: hypothetical protein DDW52_24605, partial [Planctomycetaceae bacterium]|nr:hypothetical protein [Planctomycetaceae bacterium]